MLSLIIFKLELQKNIVIFKISTIEFFNMQSFI